MTQEAEAPGRLRSTLRAGAALVVSLGSVATAAGFVGRWWWPLDLIANFRPQLALVTLVALGLAVVSLDRRWSAIAGIAVLVNVAAVGPFLVGSPPGVVDGSPTVEILSFNVGVSNPQRGAVVSYIEQEGPDLVFLFESSVEWEAELRAANLDLAIVSIVPKTRLAGVTVLARPDLLPRSIDTGLVGEAAAVSITLGSQEVDVLGVHPLSPTTARRASQRDELLEAAGRWVRERPSEVIVVGDLNASPWSHAFRRLRKSAGLVDSLRGRGLQPTWPAGWGPLMITIDHALHTAGLAVESRRTGPNLDSSHRPLIVTLGWAG